MTELEIARLEAVICARAKNPEPIDKDTFFVLKAVPMLITEVRKLRAMRALGITIPPEPSRAEAEALPADEVQGIVRDVGEMIGECCPEGGFFLLTLFDAHEGHEPVYTFNASHEDTIKALRRVIELVEQS